MVRASSLVPPAQLARLANTEAHANCLCISEYVALVNKIDNYAKIFPTTIKRRLVALEYTTVFNVPTLPETLLVLY